MNKSNLSQAIYQARIERVLAFINEHLAEELGLEQLAGVALFSPFHFHRIFTGVGGETPHDFIRRLRLEKAANMLLKNPGLSITDIAMACGFSSPATFARSFKAHFGRAAGRYRVEAAGGFDEAGAGPAFASDRVSAGMGEMPAVEVRMMPRFHVAYVANREGYQQAKIDVAWRKLTRWAAARDLLTPETVALGLSLDDTRITPRHRCRYYACLTVPDDLVDGQIGVMDIPAGKVGVYRLVGAAEEIEPAYHRLFGRWLPESGYQPDDRPCYDVYHATPETNPEGQFVMDICIPVKPL